VLLGIQESPEPNLLLYCAAVETGGNLLINLKGGERSAGRVWRDGHSKGSVKSPDEGNLKQLLLPALPLQSVARLPSPNQYPRTTNGDGGNGGNLLMSIPRVTKGSSRRPSQFPTKEDLAHIIIRIKEYRQPMAVSK